MDKTRVTASPLPTPPAQRLPPLLSLGENRRCCQPPWRPRRPTPPAGMKTCWISRMRDSTGMEPSPSANWRSAFPKTHLTATDLDSGPNSAPTLHGSFTRRGLSLLLAFGLLQVWVIYYLKPESVFSFNRYIMVVVHLSPSTILSVNQR